MTENRNLISDRYLLKTILGKGGGGRVFGALDTWLQNSKVAIKLVSYNFSSVDTRQTLHREFALLSRFNHPCIVPALDMFSIETPNEEFSLNTGDFCLVEPWIEGQSAASMKQFREDEVALIGLQITAALSVLHSSHIRHGDIKPSNIMLQSSPQTKAWLIDFGLSHLKAAMGSGGTPIFMPPESLRNSPQLASDIFSLGKTMAEMLNPSPEPNKQLGNTLEIETFDGLLHAMTHQRWEKRPTASEVFSALTRFTDRKLGGAPIKVLRDHQHLQGASVHSPKITGPISQWLRGNLREPVTILRGVPGTGKTFICREVELISLTLERTVVGSIRDTDRDSEDSLKTLAIELNAPPPASTDQFAIFRSILTGLQGLAQATPITLIWDNLKPESSVDIFLKWLTPYYAEFGDRLRIFGATQIKEITGPNEQTCHLDLDNFNLEQTQSFLKTARPLRTTDEIHAEKLHKLSGGNAQLLMELLLLNPGDKIHSATLKSSAPNPETSIHPWEKSLALFAWWPKPWSLNSISEVHRLSASEIQSIIQRGLEHGLLKTASQTGQAGYEFTGQVQRKRLQNLTTTKELETILSSLETIPPHEQNFETILQIARLSFELKTSFAHLKLLQAYESANSHEHHRIALELLHNLLSLKPDPTTAITYFYKQGWHYENQGQLPTALKAYEKALQAPQAKLGFARVCIQLGNYQEANQVLEGIKELDPKSTKESETLYIRSLVFTQNLSKAADFIEEILASDENNPFLADVWVQKGLVAFYKGQNLEAVRALEYAQKLCAEDPSLNRPASLEANLALAYHKANQLQLASTLYQQAVEQAEVGGHQPKKLNRLINLSTLQHDLCDYPAAEKSLQEANTLAKQLNIPVHEVRSGLAWSNLLCHLGRFTESAEILDNTLRVAEITKLTTETILLKLVKAEIATAREDYDEAIATLQKILSESETQNNLALLTEAFLIESQIAWRQNNLSKMQLKTNEAIKLSEQSGDDHLIARCKLLHLLSALLDHQEKPQELQKRLSDAINSGQRIHDKELRWKIYLGCAFAARRRGQTKQVRDFIDRAEKIEREIVRFLNAKVEQSYHQHWFRKKLMDEYRKMDTQSLSNHSHGLQQVLRINRLLAQEHNRERLLDRIIDSAITLTGAERGILLLAEPEGGNMTAYSGRATGLSDLRNSEQSFSQTIAHEAMTTGQPVISWNASGDERFAEQMSIHQLQLRSVMCLPIIAEPTIRGALYLDHRQQYDVFNEFETPVVQAFADQIALAMYNAQLIGELKSQTKELQESQSTIEALNQKLETQLDAQSEELNALRAKMGKEGPTEKYGMVGCCAKMQTLFQLIGRISQKPIPVTIQGESGTGKELVARAIHQESPRKNGPFVGVNCGALTEELLESELFGHEKGAFTGAVRGKLGLFEVANGGTIFLDEIGEMPLSMQVKLLRVLHQKEYRKVGGTKLLTTNARVLCATNRNLKEMVTDGSFREDLWYRINVVELTLPSLRERTEDLPHLIAHLIQKHSQGVKIDLKKAALKLLLQYPWPGNIRELENEIQRTLILCDDSIGAEDLSPKLREKIETVPELNLDSPVSLKDLVGSYEKKIIIEALKRNENRVAKAAELLGLTRVGLYKKINKFGINEN
ncbi:MAG: sigma 54-interacting transcriptional regulator [Myxococcota bacterium]|nr:sigma 54-interacting transcriptional regulator [Myxococcota bacterium]